jgi:hypothetical protein
MSIGRFDGGIVTKVPISVLDGSMMFGAESGL